MKYIIKQTQIDIICAFYHKKLLKKVHKLESPSSMDISSIAKII